MAKHDEQLEQGEAVADGDVLARFHRATARSLKPRIADMIEAAMAATSTPSEATLTGVATAMVRSSRTDTSRSSTVTEPGQHRAQLRGSPPRGGRSSAPWSAARRRWPPAVARQARRPAARFRSPRRSRHPCAGCSRCGAPAPARSAAATPPSISAPRLRATRTVPHLGAHEHADLWHVEGSCGRAHSALPVPRQRGRAAKPPPASSAPG